ncbi:DUF1574 family protein [Leptospira levettii]|uniref:DUF1574 family protein n=1 Tax=Leptospira levettii TaxID=2023178 RepID=UPI001082CB2C|nr:DUF1574 family protein [Leptospira levettii]MCW7506982.1 DUF1574 domain-containing protein [Leptospira levettii]MCW7518072.1 DUF1574 domain-containing protein [Leptospira levettii]TGK99528.1 DUF1574 domain-containing protein [Leptospira levettii]
MTHNKIYFYPFILIFFVFTIDKIACIPDFREAARRPYKSGQNILIGFPKVWEENKRLQSDKINVTVVTGSSRSDIFHEWENIPVNKNTYNQPIYFETRLALKASEYFLYYLLLKSMVNGGFKPNLLFIEFSEEMLNENNVYSYKTKWKELMLTERELIDIYPVFNLKYKLDILTRLLFVSYNYHIRPIQGISNLIKGERAADDTYFIALSSYLNKKRPFNPNNTGIEIDNFTPKEYEERIVNYSRSQEQLLLNNFLISETEVGFLKKIIDLAEENNIPTVIWEPQVHPYYKERRKSITGGNLFDTISERLIEKDSKNIRRISLNRGNTNCRLYTDSSHVSPLCVPEIVDKLLQTAKEIPNFQ